MYEEIFNDVQKVKDILIKAGIKNIRSTKIFNLLEDLKSPEIVAQVLVESKDFMPSDPVSDVDMPSEPSEIENVFNKTDVEVIEEIRNDDKVRIIVDLTKASQDVVSNPFQKNEIIEQVSFLQESPMDESNEDSLNEENSINQNDLSNDVDLSDVDNYYTTSDYEEDSIKQEEIEVKEKSPPPILSILKDLSENLAFPEEPTPVSFNEVSESENFEILEENNNDPNNNSNLGEIQLVEQSQPRSPVAGCSKDFIHRKSEWPDPSTILSVSSEDSNIQILKDSSSNSPQYIMEPQPSCSKDYIRIEESDSEIEDHDFQTTSQFDYEKLLEETQLINQFFPDLSGDMIFSMLDKYKKAINRTTIVLWELLPRERPEPNIPKRKKHENKPHPVNFKTNSTTFSSPTIDNKIMKKIQQDVKNNEKQNFSEIGASSSSAENITTQQSLIEPNNDNQQMDFLKDKDKSLSHPNIIKPAQFTYQSNPMPAKQTGAIKKTVLSAPKLILNAKESNLKNKLSLQSAPKRKLSLIDLIERGVPDNKLLTDDFNMEFSTNSTIPLNKNINYKPHDDGRKSKIQKLEPNLKKIKNVDEMNTLNIASLPSFAPSVSDSLSLGFQKYNNLKVYNVSSNLTDINGTFKLSSPINISSVKNETIPALDFLNPNRENQFYQMPTSSSSAPSSIQSHASKSNSPIKSTSATSVDPPKVMKYSPSLTDVLPGNSKTIKTLKTYEIPCTDTYYKLRSIFPDVDPEFIKEKCVNPPFDVKSLNMEQQLNMFVELLLNEGSNHRQIHEILEESVDLGNKDEQYENLLGIFPEADPTFLRNFVDTNYNNPDSLKTFIQQNLEKPAYPTREHYLQKIKITQQIKEYTTDFDIKKFLQIFPDPFEQFENANRNCTYKPMAYEFLKDIFRKHKVATISYVYRHKKYNLSLTANHLTKMVSDMKGRRSYILIPTEDIPLLQEIAYIKHKKEIVEYLEDIKRNELLEFENLKKQGKLIECQCCFNDECLPRKCFTCENGHPFCEMCILRGTESKMGDGQNHVSCFTNCDSEFSLSVLQEVLPPTTFSILLQKRQQAEVMAAGLEGLVSCPFCHFASIPSAESKVFKCLNPDCMKETCRLCKELNHVPLKCDEVLKEDQARLQLEEKMTKALVRNCYKCQKPFFKEEGCNKMTCVCGASMCYLCSKPLVNGEYKHFNGQGSSNSKLCPLWTDNRRMNAEAVRKVAEATENELKKKNPNLKVNTKAILPDLPAKTRGPHDDIPNAHALPEYVRRIANLTP